MTPYNAITPVQRRASELSQKIHGNREALREIEWRLGTPLEKPGDMERARHFTQVLGGLAQEMKIADDLLNQRSAAPEVPTQAANKGRLPDFDLDDSIQWVGRTI